MVLITTKRGKSGSTRLTFDNYQGWSRAPKVFQVVSGPQLAQLENERFLNDGGTPAALPYRSVASGG